MCIAKLSDGTKKLLAEPDYTSGALMFTATYDINKLNNYVLYSQGIKRAMDEFIGLSYEIHTRMQGGESFQGRKKNPWVLEQLNAIQGEYAAAPHDEFLMELDCDQFLVRFSLANDKSNLRGPDNVLSLVVTALAQKLHPVEGHVVKEIMVKRHQVDYFLDMHFARWK